MNKKEVKTMNKILEEKADRYFRDFFTKNKDEIMEMNKTMLRDFLNILYALEYNKKEIIRILDNRFFAQNNYNEMERSKHVNEHYQEIIRIFVKHNQNISIVDLELVETVNYEVIQYKNKADYQVVEICIDYIKAYSDNVIQVSI